METKFASNVWNYRNTNMTLLNTNNCRLEITESADTTVASPTQSQMAKKKLGFEGLFDSTDPNVTDIDDVIGLCSGQFLTQHQADMSPMFDEFWKLVVLVST